MIRGTTPTHIFTLPFDGALVAKCNIVYAQEHTVVLKKRETDCRLEGRSIVLKLTQADTLLFDSDKDVSIQLHLLTAGGDALVSNIYTVAADQCLDDEVIV